MANNERGFKGNFEALGEINHKGKKDYQELERRLELIKSENQRLEKEENELKLRVKELEERQRPLKDELARLAAALYAEKRKSVNAGLSEEQCELLKSQMIVYKEDFDKERIHREILHEEKENYKRKVEDSEEIIRQLTTELDAFTAREEFRRRRDGSGNLRERFILSIRHQMQYLNAYLLQDCSLTSFVVEEV